MPRVKRHRVGSNILEDFFSRIHLLNVRMGVTSNLLLERTYGDRVKAKVLIQSLENLKREVGFLMDFIAENAEKIDA